jgi:hypothetical protein
VALLQIKFLTVPCEVPCIGDFGPVWSETLFSVKLYLQHRFIKTC